MTLDLSTLDPKAVLRDLDRADCEDSLYVFLQHAWKYVDAAPFTPGWPLEAVCEHLEAVIDGEIKRLIINIPPRCGKPVRVDAWIPTMERGLVRLADIAVGNHVLTHKGRFRAVTAVHEQGVLPTFTITTRSHREVAAATDHPFLTTEGWRELGSIVRDDVVGIVPQLESSGAQTVTPETARLLGYLVGDGACYGTPNITVADDIEAADIIHCVRSVGLEPSDISFRMASTGYMLRRIGLTAPKGHTHNTRKGYRGPSIQFLEKYGLYKKSSYTKSVPVAVMEGSDDIVRNFVGAYWACDGYVISRGCKSDGSLRDDLTIGCDSVNREFMLQMQALLLRLGIVVGVRTKISRRKTKRQVDAYTSYSIRIADQDNAWRFASQIVIPHSKNAKLASARKRRFDFDRPIVGEVVESVEPAGDHPCRCLTVEGDESFVANGFAVHNSTITSVCFPAFVWAQERRSPTSGPGVQLLHASYALNLAMRDSVKCRRLIESPWYQRLWGDRFKLVGDQNTKGRFANTEKGERLITAVEAKVTGEGGSIIVIDDPNAANEVLSEATIESTKEWWDGTMSTRLNDPNTGAFVVIQQRLGEEDLTGHILETDHGWTHLCLPMEFESERSVVTSIGWEDPRDEPGELLWPERFNGEQVKDLSRRLGPWKAAGQLQQRPEPKGGGIIKREWWKLWEDVAYPPMDMIVAYLDTAYTEKTENDESALTIWGVFQGDVIAKAAKDQFNNIVRTFDQQHPRVMLMDAWSDRLQLHELVEKVAATCKKMKVDKLLIENKAAGHSVAQEIRRLFGHEGFSVQLDDPKGQDKVARLYSIQHLFAEGMIHAPDRAWADKVITQVGSFPKGKHDDLVDTVSGALRHLRTLGLLIRGPEWTADLAQQQEYHGAELPPLYPA